jgi:hypothetical protein
MDIFPFHVRLPFWTGLPWTGLLLENEVPSSLSMLPLFSALLYKVCGGLSIPKSAAFYSLCGSVLHRLCTNMHSAAPQIERMESK